MFSSIPSRFPVLPFFLGELDAFVKVGQPHRRDNSLLFPPRYRLLAKGASRFFSHGFRVLVDPLVSAIVKGCLAIGPKDRSPAPPPVGRDS